MFTADVVLLCALNLLGRSASSFPPIEFVQSAPVDASPGVEAYVGPSDGHIYILTTSAAFQRLLRTGTRCGDIMAARKMASVLVHEELHIRQNASEKTAYQAQLLVLTTLGANVGSPPYQEVMRAMRHVAQQRRDPTRLMASTGR